MPLQEIYSYFPSTWHRRLVPILENPTAQEVLWALEIDYQLGRALTARGMTVPISALEGLIRSGRVYMWPYHISSGAEAPMSFSMSGFRLKFYPEDYTFVIDAMSDNAARAIAANPHMATLITELPLTVLWGPRNV